MQVRTVQMGVIQASHLHFDTFAGASGDMIIGALLDAGASFEQLQSDLARLRLDGYALSLQRVKRAAIDCAKFDVNVTTVQLPPHDHHHDHDRHHDHLGRGFHDIAAILEAADLSPRVKEQAKAVFWRLAEVEGRVHGIPPEAVHFHEVGAVDAIVDIVGACLCFEQFGVRHFTSSPLRTGFGLVACAHGRYPIPAPGTAELLKGVPFYAGDIEGEFTTPTGAAIITTLCQGYAPSPNFTVTRTGYGAGMRNVSAFPNALRVFLGVTTPTADDHAPQIVSTLEANVDDQSPQQLGYVMERLLSAGALDVFFTPIYMKKNRPAVLLTVLGRPEDESRLANIIFQETTTLGIRTRQAARYILPRRQVQVTTAGGEVRVKVATLADGTEKISPEYEDCRRVAEATGQPLWQVYAVALQAYEKQQTANAE